MRFYLALYTAKFILKMLHIFAKDRGTFFPGKIALKIDPKFIKHIKGIDTAKTVFITGTNGKTTVSYLVKKILENTGKRVGIIGTNEILVGSDAVGIKSSTPTTGMRSMPLAAVLDTTG